MTPGATQRLPPVLKFPGGPLSRTDQRAQSYVSKVAVVDVFCAFRVVVRVHLVVVVVVVLGSPWLFVALRGDHTAPRAGIATTRTALHHQNTQRKTSSLFAGAYKYLREKSRLLVAYK